jgi:hypothetical protein
MRIPQGGRTQLPRVREIPPRPERKYKKRKNSLGGKLRGEPFTTLAQEWYVYNQQYYLNTFYLLLPSLFILLSNRQTITILPNGGSLLDTCLGVRPLGSGLYSSSRTLL